MGMRLIDADELMKAMYHRAFETDGDTMWQSGCWVRYRAIEQVVKEQPTVERKTGKWIDETFEPWGLVYHPYKCNQCGEHSEANSNYCQNCGARMER